MDLKELRKTYLYGTFRHVRFSFAGLDICQGPFSVCLCDKLEAKDTIFSQEHILGEDVHSVNTLLAQSVSH